MINLSVQDEFDGNGKVDELRSAIGKSFSDNRSSTLNSRLVSISDDGDRAYTEEVKSEYSNRVPKSGIKSQPSWLVWNGMFY